MNGALSGDSARFRSSPRDVRLVQLDRVTPVGRIVWNSVPHPYGGPGLVVAELADFTRRAPTDEFHHLVKQTPLLLGQMVRVRWNLDDEIVLGTSEIVAPSDLEKALCLQGLQSPLQMAGGRGCF